MPWTDVVYVLLLRRHGGDKLVNFDKLLGNVNLLDHDEPRLSRGGEITLFHKKPL